ncbi:dienelactone hydrolase family protein [Methylocystis heyeri]|uniref:Alpha/beta fold hydrolase n=1 Tax=Methylocystis heyeri TaxID=391905 RepID=A0A6B8KBL7_9HYPH|nr:alpha/beta fold hydrolase [Methylocystis heyeri]QGM44421.1 alpha/beta fold hydrolase [Methylocystis heyeri]
MVDLRRSAVAVGIEGLDGSLFLPPRPIGLIIFAHGSGSSRHSPRNNFVARKLADEGLAALLFDLLNMEESENRENVFDISLLASRLAEAVDWASASEELRRLPIGLFGASTGAAAALVTAAQEPRRIAAVVSRGGRPDLAAAELEKVAAPTLLIVGGLDFPVIELNRKALQRLRCEACLEIVPGATHLFEETGALENVADLAANWFLRHIRQSKKTTEAFDEG